MNKQKSTSIQDMTVGSPVKLLLTFAIPMLIGNLFQQLYNMVDSIVVGKFVSSNALAAVGASGSLGFLFFSLCFGMSAGIGIMISQYFGAGEGEKLKRTIANSIYVIGVSALLMAIIGFVFARPILVLLHTPQIILEDAVLYLKVSSLGILAIALYNGVSAILRALGDSKTPLVFLIVACLLNIVLDVTFVVGLSWGVFGVAIATAIAQVVAGIGCLVYARISNPYFTIEKEFFKPDMDIIDKSMKLGIPVGLQNSMIALSCVFLQSVVNGFGEDVVAAFTATGRVEQLVQQPFGSLGAAISTFTGQNIGAGKLDRVKEGYKKSIIIVAIFSAVMLGVMYLFANPIMGLFVNEVSVIEIGAKGLIITSWFYFFLGVIYVSRNVLNGAGDAVYAMINGIVEVAGRVCFSIPLTQIALIGMWGIWITTGLTWFITGTASFVRYKQGKWMSKSIISRK